MANVIKITYSDYPTVISEIILETDANKNMDLNVVTEKVNGVDTKLLSIKSNDTTAGVVTVENKIDKETLKDYIEVLQRMYAMI